MTLPFYVPFYVPFFVSRLATPAARGLRWTRLLPALYGVWLMAAPLAAQTPTVPDGPEVQVNSYTLEDQGYPSIAVQPDGGFVVVWESAGSSASDTSDISIQGQRFAADGTPLGSQFQVNSYTTGDQEKSSVVVGPDGDFVVVWESAGSFGTGTVRSIQGQRFASSGDPLGTQFQVNSNTDGPQYSPSIAAGPSGDFVVVWNNGTASDANIQGQRFAADGDPQGVQFRIETFTDEPHYSLPSIAVASEGDFVVVWENIISSGTDAGYSIEGQRFAANGTPLGGQFQVNSYTPSHQTQPSVAPGPDGAFVVVWSSFGSPGDDTSGASIQGQRFADGAPLGSQFQVNAYTTGPQSSSSITVDPEGDFVVTWSSLGSPGDDTSGMSIQGQRFAASGEPIGEQFQINSYTTGGQDGPSVAVGSDGDFVVAWSSEGSSGDDTSSRSVQAQRFRVTADIGDKVFLDADFDGRQDFSEEGVPGVAVHLRDDLGDLLESTVTGADGTYLFQPKIALAGVADRFFVEFGLPESRAFTVPNAGTDDAIDSDADPFFGQTATFEVASAGEQHLDVDAGLIADDAVIGDRVWIDADGDGLQQVDERGVVGVTVRLLDAAGGEVQSTTTDSSGLYAFADPETGLYSIEVVLPPGAELTRQDVGSDDEIDSDADPATGRSEPFGYSAGDIGRDVDIGLVLPSEIFSDGFESGDLSAWSPTFH